VGSGSAEGALDGDPVGERWYVGLPVGLGVHTPQSLGQSSLFAGNPQNLADSLLAPT
jgi:hypothetical protein